MDGFNVERVAVRMPPFALPFLLLIGLAGDAGPQTPEPYRISVNVDLVVLHPAVRDGKGRFASDLREQDFEVYEDGVRQSRALDRSAAFNTSARLWALALSPPSLMTINTLFSRLPAGNRSCPSMTASYSAVIPAAGVLKIARSSSSGVHHWDLR